ncbi:unnamed protein product [Owenia fusiformis]|nr:unnamed protein product [Owenia fusiformis]
MEWNYGEINYARPENAINAMLAQNVSLRGHCVYWGVEQFTPNWIRNMTGEEVRAEVTRRANGVVDRFRGRLHHWDVNNENLHGKFFEEKTGNADIMADMFREVRDLDPACKLFINDYLVVNEGWLTTALANQARELQAAGFEVYIGAQGHFGLRDGRFDPAWVQRRLDSLAAPGVPLWITELDCEDPDFNVRADKYEAALRAFFSHPSVEGIIIWGFWDGAHFRPGSSLVDGEDFTINAAGLRWQQLIQQEWRTQQDYQLYLYDETINFRGFHGDYDVIVLDNGVEIQRQSFTLNKDSGTLSVNVNIE